MAFTFHVNIIVVAIAKKNKATFIELQFDRLRIVTDRIDNDSANIDFQKVSKIVSDI